MSRKRRFLQLPVNTVIIVVSCAWGPTFRLGHFTVYTYKTWWFMKGPESTKTKAYKLIPKVKIPILFLLGWNDRLVENLETTELAKIANEASNNSAIIKYIPGARHEFMEILVKLPLQYVIGYLCLIIRKRYKLNYNYYPITSDWPKFNP